MNPFAKMVAVCLRDYGAVINDTSGKFSLRFDATVSFTSQGKPDPWPAAFGAKGVNYSDPDIYRNQANVREVLSTIPFEQLEFLPLDYGKNGEM
jgi:hypothetical protein